MGLFKKRQKRTLSSWCEEMLSKIVFPETPALKTMDQIDLDKLKKTSPSFPSCSLEDFSYEWSILKLEVISVAFSSTKKLVDKSAQQTEFFKQFVLKQKNGVAMLEKLDGYNKITGKSVDLPARKSQNKLEIAKINQARMSIYDRLSQTCQDDRCVASAANRVNCSDSIKSQIFHYLQSFELLDALGMPESEFMKSAGRNETTNYVSAMIDGLIKGTQKDLAKYDFT